MGSVLMLIFNIFIHTQTSCQCTHATRAKVRSGPARNWSSSKLKKKHDVYFTTYSNESIILPELLLNFILKEPIAITSAHRELIRDVEHSSGKQIMHHNFWTKHFHKSILAIAQNRSIMSKFNVQMVHVGVIHATDKYIIYRETDW